MEVILPNATRVTTILSIFQAYSHVRPGKLKRAQDIGTDIHEAIESYFNGTFSGLDAKKMPYFTSFLEWVKAANPEVLIYEKRFYDRKKLITGKLDLLCRINGMLYLVDFKTGSWCHPEIWELQSTFYRWLLEQNDYLPLPNNFMTVVLKSDGSPSQLFEYTFKQTTFEICMAAWECYRYFSKALV